MKRHRTKRAPESAKVREDSPAYGTTPPRFIDLFCGIGGFRIAFEKAGGRCVFSSDYDKFSQQKGGSEQTGNGCSGQRGNGGLGQD